MRGMSNGGPKRRSFAESVTSLVLMQCESDGLYVERMKSIRDVLAGAREEDVWETKVEVSLCCK